MSNVQQLSWGSQGLVWLWSERDFCFPVRTAGAWRLSQPQEYKPFHVTGSEWRDAGLPAAGPPPPLGSSGGGHLHSPHSSWPWKEGLSSPAPCPAEGWALEPGLDPFTAKGSHWPTAGLGSLGGGERQQLLPGPGLQREDPGGGRVPLTGTAFHGTE